MTYNPNIPQANDFLSESQGDILSNFQVADASYDLDHFAFSNGTTSRGKHKNIRFPQVLAASPGTAVGELAFYTKLDSLNIPQFFFQGPNVAPAGIDTQLTKTVPQTQLNLNGAGSSNFYSFLPNNLIVITGNTTNSVEGGTIDLGITNLNGIVYIGLCALGNSSSGTNRALVAQPRSTNLVAGTMVINLQDVNNNDQNVARTIYFYCVVVKG